jgi:hypothetical protein
MPLQLAKLFPLPFQSINSVHLCKLLLVILNQGQKGLPVPKDQQVQEEMMEHWVLLEIPEPADTRESQEKEV